MSAFTFQQPVMFLFLLGGPLLLWLMRRARAKRQRTREIWGQGSAAPLGSRREAFWLLSYLVLVLALARPGYSPVRHSISNTGRDVVFVLDVSRSMLAQDVYPSRLESAKQGISDCLDALGSEQVGLVIYGGSSSISCPLTTDYGFVRYMLSQVRPRSVEFGGTFLLSAIEKVVDQVLDAERAGFQDVVVLTDGEDHAPDLQKVVERVRESGVNLLVLGLGDFQDGAPIPIEREDGTFESLRFEGDTVYTAQQREALREFVKQCPEGEYVNAGTQPYHLGDIYRAFSAGKETSAMEGESGYTVYKEGAFFLMPLALLFAVLAHPTYWKGALRCALLFAWMGAAEVPGARAQELEASFEQARELFESKQFEEAAIAFRSLMESEGHPAAHAALSFNLGLAYWQRSLSQGEESPREALSHALHARESFLLAAREDPALLRAKLRLGQLAGVIRQLEAQVAEEEEEQQQQNEALQALLERIEALLLAQQELRAANRAADPQRASKRPVRPVDRSEPGLEPADGAALSGRFSGEQGVLLLEGTRIQETMREWDARLSEAAAKADASLEAETVLSTPLVLMQQAIEGQAAAAELLELWQNWPNARTQLERVEARLQEILDIFAAPDSEEGDEDDWEDYEDYEMSDDGEGMPSSMAMEGDLKANAQMQALPVPNYSAEEILSEERGSQQFREEQRAKANAGKVEKDW